MEEQKNEKKEELQKEKPDQGNSSTRSSILWIFAGGYLVYTGYRLCRNVLTGAEDASAGFLIAGGIFCVIGAVLLIMAIRNLAKEGARKQALEETAAKANAEQAEKEEPVKKNLSISQRAHLVEKLDEKSEEETD